MDLLLNLRRTVNNFPDAPAIIDGSIRMNWREYDMETRHVAAGLVSLGTRPGDRIAILALNSSRYAILYYAVIRIGAILVPLNTVFPLLNMCIRSMTVGLPSSSLMTHFFLWSKLLLLSCKPCGSTSIWGTALPHERCRRIRQFLQPEGAGNVQRCPAR